MKVWVFCSATHYTDECVDIQDTKVFQSYNRAKSYFDHTIADHISDEGGWTVFSDGERHVQLIDGDNEYVAYVAECDI